jgi:hypothetical protein
VGDLAEQIKETEVLLRRRKAELAQRAVNDDGEATASELTAITKLEVRLASLEQFHRLQELTREEPS